MLCVRSPRAACSQFVACVALVGHKAGSCVTPACWAPTNSSQATTSMLIPWHASGLPAGLAYCQPGNGSATTQTGLIRRGLDGHSPCSGRPGVACDLGIWRPFRSGLGPVAQCFLGRSSICKRSPCLVVISRLCAFFARAIRSPRLVTNSCSTLGTCNTRP
jgi:hypothetical protein